MERKGILVPAVLALGAAAFYLMVLTSRESTVIGQYQMGRVLVARVDIPERTVLKEELVETVEMPRKYMAQDSFEVRTPSDIRMVANLVNRVRILRGNQIQQSTLISLSPEAGLAVKVPPGYRGAVLPVEPELRALIKPGDRVDVLVTFDAVMGDGRKQKVTATILQNILVLSVGHDLGQGMTARQFKASGDKEERTAGFSEKASIGLALNPTELQYLSLCSRQGDVTVGMRGLGDNVMHPIPMSTMSQLFKD